MKKVSILVLQALIEPSWSQMQLITPTSNSYCSKPSYGDFSNYVVEKSHDFDYSTSYADKSDATWSATSDKCWYELGSSD